MKRTLLLTALTTLFIHTAWSQCETVQWGDNFGGNLEDRQRNTQLAVSPDGTAIVGGVFTWTTVTIGSNTYNNTSTNANVESGILAKYDADGNVLWSDLIGGTDQEAVEGLAADQNNNVYAVGASRSDTMWYGNNSMFSLIDTCNFDFFIIKYNAQGVPQWDRRPENPSPHCANGQASSSILDIVTDNYGNLYVGGYFNGDTLIVSSDTLFKTSPLEDEVFIAKLDTSGNLIWAKSYGFSYDESLSLAVDRTGNVFYTGNFINATVNLGTYTFNNANASTADVLTIKFDPNGNIIWADAAGGSNEDLTLGSTTDSDGNLYIIGGFLSTSLTFGSVTINNALGVDMYLVKYLPNGTVDWGFTGTGTAIRYGMDVSTSPTDEIYITGLYVFGALNFGSVNLPTPTTVNGFIVKFDQQGNALWGVTPTTNDTLSAAEIEIAATGDIYSSGTFKGASSDFNGVTLTNTGNSTYDNFIYKFTNGIHLTTSTTNANCQTNDGDASVSIVGGTGPYDYAWTSGDTLATADSLTSGLYTVTVTDANGCTAFATALVNDNSGPSVTANVTDITCSGDNDGAIDVTISGGVAPYAVSWSNGAVTEDISALQPGPYEITVTDDAGCVTIASFTVDEPSEMMFSTGIVQPTCTNNNGSATVQVTGGTAPYGYVWDSGGNAATENNLSAGAYWVTVTDVNNCVDSTLVAVSDLTAPTISIDSIIPTTCGNSSGTVFTSVTGGLAPYDFLWSNGFTLPNLAGAAAGTYSVEVEDQNNCIAVTSVTIGTGLVSAPVCMVTVDSASQSNLVIWEKTPGLGISQYNIYRESSQLNVYQLAGTVPFDSLSEFVDTIADPSIRSWRYKISATDSCGNESNQTDAHKTIHLTINIGLSNSINLLWDDYEGFAYSTYFIYRYTNTNGWEQIAALSSSSNSYTDLPPTFDGLYYSVIIDHPSGCVVTRAAGNNNTARSNEAELASGGGNDIAGVENNMKLLIFPNPNNGLFNVAIGAEDATDVQLEIFDVQGKVVLSKQWNGISGEHVQTIDLSNQESGVYLFRAKTSDNVLIRKLVIK